MNSRTYHISMQWVVIFSLFILLNVLGCLSLSTNVSASDKLSESHSLDQDLGKNDCKMFMLDNNYMKPTLSSLSINMSSSIPLSNDCIRNNSSCRYVPPLLLTFPGSGNTWVRLLIEVLTGKGSGSLHLDDTLEKIFKLQNACNSSVSVIKSHPYGIVRNTTNGFFSPMNKKVCGAGGYYHFEKVIFIDRNLIEASWATFHLSLSGSHSSNFKRFPDSRYEQWKTFVLRAATQMESDWNNKIYPFILKHPTYFHSISFQNLTSPTRNAEELKKICKFMGNCNPINLDDRIRCAFILANHPEVHRIPDVNVSSSSPEKPLNYLQMTFEKFPSLECEIRQRAKNYYSYFHYPMLGNNTCHPISVS